MRPKELPSLDEMNESFFLIDGMLYRSSGKKVDPSRHRSGYRFVSCHGQRHAMHRIVYCIANGVRLSPDQRIDHIDGNTDNNHPSNLRIADPATNARNQKFRSTNRSGAMGVRFVERLGKWRSQIGFKGKNLHLGFFKTFEEAVDARRSAEAEYGYDPSHGNR